MPRRDSSKPLSSYMRSKMAAKSMAAAAAAAATTSATASAPNSAQTKANGGRPMVDANGSFGRAVSNAIQSRCYLCETPKQEYSLIRSFSEVVCRGCLNYEGPDRIEQLIADARKFKSSPEQTSFATGQSQNSTTVPISAMCSAFEASPGQIGGLSRMATAVPTPANARGAAQTMRKSTSNPIRNNQSEPQANQTSLQNSNNDSPQSQIANSTTSISNNTTRRASCSACELQSDFSQQRHVSSNIWDGSAFSGDKSLAANTSDSLNLIEAQVNRINPATVNSLVVTASNQSLDLVTRSKTFDASVDQLPASGNSSSAANGTRRDGLVVANSLASSPVSWKSDDQESSGNTMDARQQQQSQRQYQSQTNQSNTTRTRLRRLSSSSASSASGHQNDRANVNDSSLAVGTNNGHNEHHFKTIAGSPVLAGSIPIQQQNLEHMFAGHHIPIAHGQLNAQALAQETLAGHQESLMTSAANSGDAKQAPVVSQSVAHQQQQHSLQAQAQKQQLAYNSMPQIPMPIMLRPFPNHYEPHFGSSYEMLNAHTSQHQQQQQQQHHHQQQHLHHLQQQRILAATFGNSAHPSDNSTVGKQQSATGQQANMCVSGPMSNNSLETGRAIASMQMQHQQRSCSQTGFSLSGMGPKGIVSQSIYESDVAAALNVSNSSAYPIVGQYFASHPQAHAPSTYCIPSHHHPYHQHHHHHHLPPNASSAAAAVHQSAAQALVRSQQQPTKPSQLTNQLAQSQQASANSSMANGNINGLAYNTFLSGLTDPRLSKALHSVNGERNCSDLESLVECQPQQQPQYLMSDAHQHLRRLFNGESAAAGTLHLRRQLLANSNHRLAYEQSQLQMQLQKGQQLQQTEFNAAAAAAAEAQQHLQSRAAGGFADGDSPSSLLNNLAVAMKDLNGKDPPQELTTKLSELKHVGNQQQARAANQSDANACADNNNCNRIGSGAGSGSSRVRRSSAYRLSPLSPPLKRPAGESGSERNSCVEFDNNAVHMRTAPAIAQCKHNKRPATRSAQQLRNTTTSANGLEPIMITIESSGTPDVVVCCDQATTSNQAIVDHPVSHTSSTEIMTADGQQHSISGGSLLVDPPQLARLDPDVAATAAAAAAIGTDRVSSSNQKQQSSSNAHRSQSSASISKSSLTPITPQTNRVEQAGKQKHAQSQQDPLAQQKQQAQNQSGPLKCLMCCERLEDRHFVQCPSIPLHKFCFACSKVSIQQQRLAASRDQNSKIEDEKIFCPSGKKCLLASERSPWTFMNNEIETIFRESSRQPNLPAGSQMNVASNGLGNANTTNGNNNSDNNNLHDKTRVRSESDTNNGSNATTQPSKHSKIGHKEKGFRSRERSAESLNSGAATLSKQSANGLHRYETTTNKKPGGNSGQVSAASPGSEAKGAVGAASSSSNSSSSSGSSSSSNGSSSHKAH